MGATETVTLRVPSRTHYLSLARSCSQEVCRGIDGLADPERTAYDVQLAVDEAVANVVQHAYEGKPDGTVELLFRLCSQSLVIDVVDWGRSFDFAQVPDPDLSEPRLGGYGIFLIRQVMDSVTYNTDPVQGNRLQMVKELVRGGER